FQRGTGKLAGYVRVKPELRELVVFRRINLLEDDWRLRGPFEVLFCLNVMIYFDRPTHARILERFRPLMKPDALLFAAHSENFSTVSRLFESLGKTVYRPAPGRATR